MESMALSENIFSYLSSTSCKLSTLLFAWNSLRDGYLAETIVTSVIQKNTSLQYLDLSHNLLTNSMGILLAHSLQGNKQSVLQKINLTGNQLHASSCVALVQSQMSSPTSSLKSIVLDENPIGEIGIRAIFSLVMDQQQRSQNAMENDNNRNEDDGLCTVSSKGCNLKIKDPDIPDSFDFNNLTAKGNFRYHVFHLNNPVHHAMATMLIDYVASHMSYSFATKDCYYYPKDIVDEKDEEFVSFNPF